MARANDEDLLQSFRYQVVEIAQADSLTVFGETTAGFNSVTVPEVSQDMAEYREGNKVYTMKFPGVPSVENIALSKGLARVASAFWDWGVSALTGNKFRTDLLIEVFGQEQTGTYDSASAEYKLKCKEVFPTRVKAIGDLDATSSDVNLQEIDGAMEELALIMNSKEGDTPDYENV